MQRSQTASLKTIAYDRASARVDFVTPQPPMPGFPDFQVRFTFAPRGAFDSFLHFHAEHAESLYCQAGQIRLTIGTTVTMIGPEDGIVEVPAWTPHRWEVLGDSAEETVVWESNAPDPEFKELFFRSVHGDERIARCQRSERVALNVPQKHLQLVQRSRR